VEVKPQVAGFSRSIRRKRIHRLVEIWIQIAEVLRIRDEHVDVFADPMAESPHEDRAPTQAPRRVERRLTHRVDRSQRFGEKRFPDRQPILVCHAAVLAFKPTCAAIFCRFFLIFLGATHAPACCTRPFRTESGVSSSRTMKCASLPGVALPESRAWTSSSG